MALSPQERSRRMRLNMLMAMSYAVAGRSAWTPSNLFAAGEQGAWYDPSDFSTMFQDAAGTTPVTAVEQPVGLIRDKSGRGNHASQSTSTSRPVLSARVNLALNSGFSGAVAGTPGTAPTNWAFVLSGGTTNSVVNDGNGGFVVSYSATAARQIVNQTVAVAVATYSAKLKIDAHTGGLKVNNIFILSSVPAGTTTDFYANGTLIDAATYTPVAGDILEARSIVTTAGNIVYRIGVGASGVSTGTVAFSMFDVRLFNQVGVLPPYQRVTTSTDYDTTGFPYYLSFDGTDDFFFLPNIGATGTEQFDVFAGLKRGTTTATTYLMSFGGSGTSTSYPGMSLLVRGSSAPAYSIQILSASASANGSILTSPAFGDTGYHVLSATRTGVRLDATAITPTGSFVDFNGYSTANNRLGCSYTFANNSYMKGDLYGFIIRFAASGLSASQVAQAETWLNTKTGAY